jgi:hypothetical protein
MLGFEQAKNELCNSVLPTFIQTVFQFQTPEIAQKPTIDFVNKVTELLLPGLIITYNQP